MLILLYVTRIQAGETTLEEVPAILREKVADELKMLTVEPGVPEVVAPEEAPEPESPEHGDPLQVEPEPAEEPLPEWSSFHTNTRFDVGEKVKHAGDAWECIKQHHKAAAREPGKDDGEYWG